MNAFHNATIGTDKLLDLQLKELVDKSLPAFAPLYALKDFGLT